MTDRSYITTAIPYVNGDPHIGFALELVQADVLARHRRHRGREVRFLTGTDDNSIKNVQAAEAASIPVKDFVNEKAARFADLRGPLQLSNDDFIRTSVDERHRPGVESLWQACAAAGDLYQRYYEGQYCSGCEAFKTADELVEGLCPEHQKPPELVAEQNWFFRLSRYETAITELIETGRLRIEPEQRRNEVLSFVRDGLTDISVSRSVRRARGWGIPVPDDETQVVYVWFDALGNYITALEYGIDGDLYEVWWREASERLHVIGKGIIRFHAVYWPAILLSAGEPMPTTIFVHDYLTVDGSKVAKSAASAIGPTEMVDRYGSDALRWWFVRDVPLVGDADFRESLLADRANELADDIGNLVNRVITLVRRFRPNGVELDHTLPEASRGLNRVADSVSEQVDAALDNFDFRSASAAILRLAQEANRYVAFSRPWDIAKREPSDGGSSIAELDAVLAVLMKACLTVGEELRPFLPITAENILNALHELDSVQARQLFPKAPRKEHENQAPVA